MTRGQFLTTLGLSAAPLRSAVTRRPNILFIAVDDLRPELGIYGASHVHSPNIDALGRSGVVFTHAYCQQAVCNPSRASILTGLRPDTLRVWDLQTHFRQSRPGTTTLPQLLRQHGYHSASIGKIFHNTLPDAPSWSEPEFHIDGFPFDPDAVYRSDEDTVWIENRKRQLTAAGQKSRSIDQYGQWYLKSAASEAPDVPDNAYYDGAQTDLAIQKLAELNQRRQPFFFGIGYYRPHLPFNAPRKYWDLYDPASLPLAPNPFLPRHAPPMAENRNRELRGYRDFAHAPTPDTGSLSEADARRLRHGYFASVSYVDAQIGRLLAQLDRLNLTQNTVVVLWGDHGWKLGDHNSWGKMTNYEIDTRVPLIIRAPGMTQAAQCHGLVECVDVFPTLCELARVPRSRELEGRSLLPLLRRPQLPGKREVFSQFLREGIWSAPDGVPYMGYSIRTASHHYVEWINWKTGQLVATELYDLLADPLENENRQEPLVSLRNQLSRRLHQAFVHRKQPV